MTQKIACIMVGLPARGKTYISRKIVRYLTWLGYPTRLFNVGNYRRDRVGAAIPSSFFDPENPEAAKTRKELATLALDDMLTWFATGSDQEDPGKVTAGFGMIAVYDATNSSIDRRQYLATECEKASVQVMFIESYCDDKDIIMSNIREVKISSPDYVGVDPMQAVEDFICRIQHYEKRYQSLTTQENVPFIKLVNVGKEVIMHNIQGYLQSRICFFLMNLNIVPRHIYFVRHGESEFNVLGRIGGDANLSTRGEAFARKLPDLMEELLADSEPSPDSSAFDQKLRARTFSLQSINGNSVTECNSSKQLTVWTSTLKRTIQTASYLSYPKFQWKQLDELDSGVCDGLTYEEIEEEYPEDYHERDNDKFNYRYKGGESYRDLVQRLEPVIMELERHHENNHAILIVGHQAVLRCIYAYFMNLSLEKLPYVNIPLHTVLKLTPKAYGCMEERFPINVPAVDTYRAKPV